MAAQPIDQQAAILMRGVEFGDDQTYASMASELKQRLLEARDLGRPLRVYCGYDPTAPDLHLGHTVTIRKLRQFQEYGHHVIFLIGTFTALIGDPSDRDRSRPRLTPKEAQENARTYAQQAFRILDPARTDVRQNSEWLACLSLEDIIELSSHFTIQQFLQRDNFARRHEQGLPIWLHEFYYALLQGYDAVALEADVQIGATEQLFNLLAGRKLQQANGQRPQVCLTLPILVGTDGVMRMSKSMGNYIGITEPPEEMYAKTMSLPDAAMPNWRRLLTRWTPGEIAAEEEAVRRGSLHPMQAKKRLAAEIASIFWGEEAAARAAARFRRVIQDQQPPDDPPSVQISEPRSIVDLLHAAGIASSKTRARRLVEQGAVRLDGQPITDIDHEVRVEGQATLRAGRQYVRLVSDRLKE